MKNQSRIERRNSCLLLRRVRLHRHGPDRSPTRDPVSQMASLLPLIPLPDRLSVPSAHSSRIPFSLFASHGTAVCIHIPPLTESA